MVKREVTIKMGKFALVVFAVVFFASPDLFIAQTTREKEFGSSLKRLKWDPEKKAATEDSSGSKNTSEDVDEGDVIKVESTLVVCDVLVATKNGKTVSGLAADDFVVKDDGANQEIATFSLGDDVNKSRSIVLIIDHSGSQRPYLNRSIAAA